MHSVHPHTAIQRIRPDLGLPHFKRDRLAHIRNHMSAERYLSSKTHSLISWSGACGESIEESFRIEDVVYAGRSLCESKPLRLVIG